MGAKLKALKWTAPHAEINQREEAHIALTEAAANRHVGTPILQTIKSGGSGTGLSMYKKWLDCPEKAYLDEQAVAEGWERPTAFALDVGIITHAFLELYYSRKDAPFDASSVEFVNDSGDGFDIEEKARITAEKLFRAYRVLFPVDELGEVVAVEKLLPEPIEDVGESNHSAQKAKIEEAVGISPYTMKTDLVVKLSTRDCAKIKITRNIDVSPGTYLVDHKTDGRHDANIIDKYLLEPQFTAYFLAWRAAYPRVKLNGVLINILFKTATPDFLTLVVPPPDDGAIRRLHTMLSNAAFMMTNAPRMKNITRCMNYGRVCHWMVQQKCKGY